MHMSVKMITVGTCMQSFTPFNLQQLIEKVNGME